MTISDEKIIQALKESNGLVTDASKMLNCAFQTIYNRIKNNAKVQQAKEDAEDTILDLAENQLFTHIKEGDKSSIFYFLNNKGKKRGYNSEEENKLIIVNENLPKFILDRFKPRV